MPFLKKGIFKDAFILFFFFSIKDTDNGGQDSTRHQRFLPASVHVSWNHHPLNVVNVIVRLYYQEILQMNLRSMIT